MMKMQHPSKTNSEEKQVKRIDCVLMQYTGLKDKNGVEIYEGDVLGGLYELVVLWCDKCKSIELFSLYETEYCYQCNGDVFWYDVAVDGNLEVIGNIYENPELLEESNNE